MTGLLLCCGGLAFAILPRFWCFTVGMAVFMVGMVVGGIQAAT